MVCLPNLFDLDMRNGFDNNRPDNTDVSNTKRNTKASQLKNPRALRTCTRTSSYEPLKALAKNYSVRCCLCLGVCGKITSVNKTQNNFVLSELRIKLFACTYKVFKNTNPEYILSVYSVLCRH